MGIPAPIVALMQQTTSETDEDFNYAQRLYDIHDVLCYGVSIFENGKHVTKNRQSLRSAVQQWQDQRTLGWDPAEIDEVTAYLNDRFFRFSASG
jgi:hypothetical protein